MTGFGFFGEVSRGMSLQSTGRSIPMIMMMMMMMMMGEAVGR